MIYIMKGNFAMTLALIGVANAPWLQRAFFLYMLCCCSFFKVVWETTVSCMVEENQFKQFK